MKQIHRQRLLSLKPTCFLEMLWEKNFLLFYSTFPAPARGFPPIRKTLDRQPNRPPPFLPWFFDLTRVPPFSRQEPSCRDFPFCDIIMVS